VIPLWYWSWILTAIGVFGLWVSSTGRSWGFLVGLAAQVLWIAYALATDQYGFIVSAIAYAWVYSRNFKTWRKQEAV
jgi:hypothetical protein